jgi:hypothetical protein
MRRAERWPRGRVAYRFGVDHPLTWPVALLLGSVLGLGLRLVLFVVATVVVRAVAVALAALLPLAPTPGSRLFTRGAEQPGRYSDPGTGHRRPARTRTAHTVPSVDRPGWTGVHVGHQRARGSRPRVRSGRPQAVPTDGALAALSASYLSDNQRTASAASPG